MRTLAGRGRGGHRQDRDHRASRRLAGDARRGSGAHPAADLHAPRRGPDAPARARHHAPGARRHARQQGPGDAAATGVGGHLSLDRQPAAAALRAPPQPRARLHGHRPERFGRSVRQPAPGTEARASSTSASRARTPAWRSIPGASIRKRACTKPSSSSSSGASAGSRIWASCAAPTSSASSAADCSTTTTCWSTGRR